MARSNRRVAVAVASIHCSACSVGAERLAPILLSLGALMMLALLVFVGRWLTFWTDEWDWVLGRRDPSLDALVLPHVDHLSAVPVLIWQALFRLFGLESYYPYLGVTWALHFSSAGLLFAIARRRAGSLVALAAGLSLVFLGSAFEDLLHAFQMAFLLSTSFGLLAIALLHGTGASTARYTGAGVALVIAVASSSVGVLFLGLAMAWAALDRHWSRLLAMLPALGLYSIWYLTWGRSGGGLADMPIAHLGIVPVKFAFGLGAAVAGVTGMPPERFAWIGLAIGIAALVVVRLTGGRISTLGRAALLALLALYGLQAIFRAQLGVEHAARSGYLYPAAIFIWLAAADPLSRVLRPHLRRSLVTAFAALILGLMILGNMVQFVGAARAMRDLRLTEVAELRLIEGLASSPGLNHTAVPDPELMPQLAAGPYLEAVEELGKPRLAIPEPRWDALGSVDPARLDRALLRLLEGSFTAPAPQSLTPPAVEEASGVADTTQADGCMRVEAGAAGATATWLPRGNGIVVRSTNQSLESLVRIAVFADPRRSEAAQVGTLADGERRIALPSLPNGLQWRALVDIPPMAVTEICDATYPVDPRPLP